MKIALLSDAHLEFGDLDIKNTQNADVLILSGDIIVGTDLMFHDEFNVLGNTRSSTWHGFFQRACREFKNVIYIFGNHEYYHGDFPKIEQHIKERLSYLSNLHVLNNQSIVIDDYTFIGTTLWTNMNNKDPMTIMQIKHKMNDFECVRNSDNMVTFKVHLPDPQNPGQEITQFKTRPSRFSPEDALNQHDAAMKFITETVESDINKKYVVVGHHAPSRKSTHPRYLNEFIMNGGYSSELSDFILDHPQIVAWTHGHTHEPFDYLIGSTRIMCNPRGYIGYEPMARNFQLKYWEI